MPSSPITTLVNDLGYVLCAAIGCLLGDRGQDHAVGNVQAMLEYNGALQSLSPAAAGMVGSFGAAAAAGNSASSACWMQRRRSLMQKIASCLQTAAAGWTFENVKFGYTADAC